MDELIGSPDFLEFWANKWADLLQCNSENLGQKSVWLYRDWIRKQIAQDLGFMAPPIHIRDNLQLRPNAYTILIKGVEVVRGEVMMGHVLAIDPGTAEKGLEGIATKEPCFGLPALWVPDSKREQAQLMGYTVVDLASVITTHLTELIRGHAHELLGRQETQALLDRMAKVAPKVEEELIP